MTTGLNTLPVSDRDTTAVCPRKKGRAPMIPRTTSVGEAEEQRLHDPDELSDDERVDLSSFDSFPASDPPSWSPTVTGKSPSQPPAVRDPRLPGSTTKR